MENRTYLVTEAEKLTGEKAHVLRYWEDELGMEIHRNSLGHRCYTAQDIQIFLGIRELKKKGLHLKAIRELMPKLVQATAEIKAFPAEAAETAKEKPDPAIPGKADEVPEVVVDLLPEREAEQLADTVMRQEEEERQTEFYRVLGRLLDQMIQKRRQEERSRRVDEAIRRHQQSRREAAATLEQKGKRTIARNIIRTPSSDTSVETVRTDAEGLIYATEGTTVLQQYPYSFTVRSDSGKSLTGVQKSLDIIGIPL